MGCPINPHLRAVVSVNQSDLWIVLKIICNLIPLISPLITNPEFAIHEGVNCGPVDDDKLRYLDVDLDIIGVGILEIISLDLALCA